MRLWNAHRRVFLRRHVRPEREKKLLAEPDGWRKIVSSDVRDWVDKLAKSHLADSPGAQRKRIIELVKDPARFFSIPKNVPKASRRQIYLSVNDLLLFSPFAIHAPRPIADDKFQA